jgi:hypothetical protein
MGKLIFTYTDKEFDVPDDMDINEYKVVCVRLASALGYSDKSIKKSFGDLVFGNEDVNDLKEILDELNIENRNKKITK